MSHVTLMNGFPPPAEAQVMLGNWRKPPFNRWAFKHVREIVPSAEIASDPANVRALPSAPQDLSGVMIETKSERLHLPAFLDRSYTDAFVILRGGRVLFEHYADDMQPSTPHILMSVSKSVLGLLAGILADRGVLDLAAPVTDLVPEVAQTAYTGATLRDLLDMRAGVLFDEDYLASAGPIIEYRKAQGWDPLDPGEEPSDLRSFYRLMTERDGGHAQRFHYVSPNTDLLGWAIERAAGRRYADLVSELIWRPMGADHSAYITVDRLGAPRCAGGFCATARDLARLGLLMAHGGRHGSRQVVPGAWIDDIFTNGDAAAWNAGDFVKYYPGMPIRYRSKWYVLDGAAPLAFGLGVFGQNLFVDPKNDIIIVKISSQPLPLDEGLISLTMRAVEAVRSHLTG